MHYVICSLQFAGTVNDINVIYFLISTAHDPCLSAVSNCKSKHISAKNNYYFTNHAPTIDMGFTGTDCKAFIYDRRRQHSLVKYIKQS